MNRAYWDDLATDADDSLLDIVREDANDVIGQRLRAVATRRGVAADLGCGPGSSLAILSGLFRKVHAVDFSSAMLAEAEAANRACGNVVYERHDLTGQRPPSINADVVLCANVLIHADVRRRTAMARNIVRGAKRGGRLLIIVPAYESALRVYQVLVECGVREGLSRRRAASRIDRMMAREIISASEGLIAMPETPTKHYLQDEIIAFVESAGATVTGTRRVEYEWSVVLDPPPRGLRGGGPWDWLVEARRDRRS